MNWCLRSLRGSWNDEEEAQGICIFGRDAFCPLAFQLRADVLGDRDEGAAKDYGGRHTFEELLENPLPDGEYAADIVGIEWNSFWGAVG